MIVPSCTASAPSSMPRATEPRMSSSGSFAAADELIGDPGLDLLDSGNELEQALERHRRTQHRGRLERGAQESLGVAVAEPDETTDHRDRHDVADLRHEVDPTGCEGPVDATAARSTISGSSDDMRFATSSGNTVLRCTVCAGGSAVAKVCIVSSPNDRRSGSPSSPR